MHVERTSMACPFNDCFRSLDYAVFDYICVLTARMMAERSTVFC